MRDLNVTLIDLTYMLVTVEIEMLESTTNIEILKKYNPKSSMDIENGNIGHQ